MPKPSIGKIVLYQPTDRRSHYAAIITKVYEKEGECTEVDLHIFGLYDDHPRRCNVQHSAGLASKYDCWDWPEH